MILRGLLGAAIGASVVAVLALIFPVASRWLDGTTRPATPNAVAQIPDDTGPALGPKTTVTHHKRHAHARPKHHQRHAVLVGGDVVVLSGSAAAPASPAAGPTPEAAAVPAKRPAKPKAPRKAPKVVTDESNPAAPAVTTPVAANAAASTGLVRLSVQSVGIAPNAAGDPELQAKLAIEGAQASDALPDTVTLHLRPQIPSTLQANKSALALNASVDMIDAPRTTPTDPALRMRVRMVVAAAASGTPTSVPVIKDPGAGASDSKSNVIALTAPLASFVREPDAGTPGQGDPATPPDNQVPGGPTSGDPTTPDQPTGGDPGPPQQPAPNDPTTPGQPTGGDPTTPGQPTGGDPTTPQQPAPSDPTTPGQPTGGDPTTPQQPAPADPTTPGTPTDGDPTLLPPTEIIIPIGPVRPNEGTATVPVAPDPTTGDAPAADPLPVVVIVEELPPDEPPPADPADQSTPVVQDPAPDVASPPADATDPSTTPAPDPAPGDATAIIVSADAPPSATNSS